MNKTMKGFVAMIMLLLVGCGAAPMKKAIVLDADFHYRLGEKVNILPVIDLRKDKSTDIDLDDSIRTPFVNSIKDKGYAVATLNDFDKKDLTMEAVAEMSEDELYVLGPKDAQSILILFVNDVSSKYVVMGYTYKVELTGLLLDKQRKTVLWKDKGVGSSGQGGLISGIMAPLVKSEALSTAVNSMIMSFPASRTKETEAHKDK